MDGSELKEVQFYKWCKECEYYKKPQEEEPCNSCLEHGMRIGTEKPECYRERSQTKCRK